MRNYQKAKWYKKIKEKGTTCYYCGKSIKGKEVTIDHKIPLSKGGMDQPGNRVFCCYKCNQIKANYDYEYFVKNRELLHQTFKNKFKDTITVNISDIKLPSYILNSTPSGHTVEKVRNYYIQNGEFDKPVTISKDMYLMDGYVRYLIAKEFDLNEIQCTVKNVHMMEKLQKKNEERSRCVQ